MNGTCQTCGAVAPIEWFLAETEHRQICAVLVELPKEVEKAALPYLSLFRPVTGRAMQAKKAARLLAELKALVAAGHVQLDHKVARPCPPRIWALAIEQMVERRDRLSLPMPNHNYLKSIAWDLADQADARAEKASNSVRPVRHADREQPAQNLSNPLDQYIQGLRDDKPSDEEMDAWKKSRLR